MENQVPSLEEFRTLNNDALASKGIQPPQPNSPVELAMYQKWLAGREKLNQIGKKPHGNG